MANEQLSTDSSSGIIAWFAHNHVAANLLMIFIICIGLISLTQIRRELNPNIIIDTLKITAEYPGASPEEVEQALSNKIEEAIKDITGIERINSSSTESMAMIFVDLMQDYDPTDVSTQIKNRIDSITNLPNESERATVELLEWKIPAIQLSLHGDIDEMGLSKLLREVRREILSLPDISSVDIFGLRDYEISIEVSELSLKKYQLTLREVAVAIQRSSIDLAGGSIQSETGDILLRTQGQASDKKTFDSIVLRQYDDGSKLLLKDVALVRDEFVQSAGLTLFDREYGAGLMVYAVGDQDVIKTTSIIKDYVSAKQDQLPSNVTLTPWQDLSHYIEGRMSLMTKNLTLGATLVFFILLIFLNFNLAFWVMAGLPVCFLGTIAMLQLNGVDVTLNMVSLFGFITVLGIMVDDAIIIGESIDSSTRVAGNNLDAVIRGVRRVAIPATFGVLTTVASFIPTLTLSSIYAPMPAAMGWVVVFCLLFSLIESKLILPAHIGHSRLTHLPAIRLISRQTDKLSNKANQILRHFIDKAYSPFLLRCMKKRYTTLASFTAGLIITAGIVSSGIVLLVVVPVSPSDFLNVRVEMIEGTPDKKTHQAVEQLVESLYASNRNYIETSGVEAGFIRHSFAWGRAGDFAEFSIELTKHEDRDIDSYEAVRLWRDNTDPIAGTKSVVFSSEDGAMGDPISFNLISDNQSELIAATKELRSVISRYEGVYDVETTLNNPLDELNLSIKPTAEALGLSLSDLGGQVRDAFYGVEAQRIQRDGDEIKVMVRYPREERKSLSDLDSMYVRTSDGDEVPFYAVADLKPQLSYASINKINGKRAVNVSAKIDKRYYNPDAVSAQIMKNDLPKLVKAYPSLHFETDGDSKEAAKLIQGLAQGFIMAIIAVYALLAIPLKSYYQPLIIMTVIPFSFIGAVFGHWWMDTAFSMMSFFGVIALTGVVVNDSLILTDAVNKRLRAQQDITEAVTGACKQRFRAILITSLTTFFGLFPLLLETSLQAQEMLPMAISLAFGILFATVITLLLVPCLFVILNDIFPSLGHERGQALNATETFE